MCLRLEKAVAMAKKQLPGELKERYLNRAKLFWKFVRDAKFSELQKLARKAAWNELKWNWQALGITPAARQAAEKLGFVPSEVFAHPIVIGQLPELFEYYRLLACLPGKGLSQIMTGASDHSMTAKCVLLNNMIGELLQIQLELSLDRIGHTLFAEAGSEWQGTWVNRIGQAAALAVEVVIVEYLEAKKLTIEPKATDSIKEGRIVLKSGITIGFGSEPDVEFRNKDDTLICVIEIKGSADRAGAQTRLGETKKSFAKAKKENRHCKTIFMPSVLTPSVEKQLKSEGEVDQVFDLLSVTKDATARKKFLKELFHFVLREKV